VDVCLTSAYFQGYFKTWQKSKLRNGIVAKKYFNLWRMLESSDGSQRITTAKLAASVGVSEAALYRHFPSKTRMFDSLIEFIEDSLITRINLILKDERTRPRACA
jgi:TetR/AcrR family transcriptional regulator